MKQLLLICAVVALVGCGEKEPTESQANAKATPNTEPKVDATPKIEPKVNATPKASVKAAAKAKPKVEAKKTEQSETTTKKDGAEGWVSDPNDSNNVKIEKAIRKRLKKPVGELTEADLEKVTGLNLANNQLTDVPKGLEKLTQLKKLGLNDNQLIDVKGLEKLTQLEGLGLANNQLTDVKGLENLTQLKDLYILKNPNLTKAQIDELQKALPNCFIISNPTK